MAKIIIIITIIIIIFKLIISSPGKNETNWNSHALPVGMQNDTDPLENSLAVSYEVKTLL